MSRTTASARPGQDWASLYDEITGKIIAQLVFVTLIEFKLTTLAGFVLIPFGLFGKTAFAGERVLGNVISSGIRVLVLAVMVGIGSTLFSQFTAGGAQPAIEDAMSYFYAAARIRPRAAFMSLAGLRPNMRPYSRVNCGTLSYPTACAATLIIAPSDSIMRLASMRRNCF